MLSERLLSLSCSTDRLRKFFVPRGIQFFNSSLNSTYTCKDFVLSLIPAEFMGTSSQHLHYTPTTRLIKMAIAVDSAAIRLVDILPAVVCVV